jgi:hypothetical protein
VTDKVLCHGADLRRAQLSALGSYRMLRATLVTSMIALAGCATSGGATSRAVESMVAFSATEGAVSLVMTCRPLIRTPGLEWVDECDRLGRNRLDEAVARGIVEQVYGPPFGDSSIFFRGMPVEVPMNERIMKRELRFVRQAP